VVSEEEGVFLVFFVGAGELHMVFGVSSGHRRKILMTRRCVCMVLLYVAVDCTAVDAAILLC
jgi:hypothetical protein